MLLLKTTFFTRMVSLFYSTEPKKKTYPLNQRLQGVHKINLDNVSIRIYRVIKIWIPKRAMLCQHFFFQSCLYACEREIKCVIPRIIKWLGNKPCRNDGCLLPAPGSCQIPPKSSHECRSQRSGPFRSYQFVAILLILEMGWK